jgi:single-strand DNA-binding protein
MIARLTKDPELSFTQGGTANCKFSVANNRTYTVQNEKKEQVSFFNCICWGKLGEVIAQYLKKGSKIALEGRLSQRSWQDKDGQKRSTVEIVVENVQFLDTKKSDGQPANEPEYTPPNADAEPQTHFSDDDIPF